MGQISVVGTSALVCTIQSGVSVLEINPHGFGGWLLLVVEWEAEHGLVWEQGAGHGCRVPQGSPAGCWDIICVPLEKLWTASSVLRLPAKHISVGKRRVPHLFSKIGTLALVISCSRYNLARKEKWKFIPYCGLKKGGG